MMYNIYVSVVDLKKWILFKADLKASELDSAMKEVPENFCYVCEVVIRPVYFKLDEGDFIDKTK